MITKQDEGEEKMELTKERIKKLNKELDKIKKTEKPLLNERNKLENSLSFIKNNKLIGKCYKYRNSYYSGKKWWLYTKVISVNEYSAKVIEVQDDKQLKTEITLTEHSASNYEKGGPYTLITKKEFEVNFKKTLNKITNKI